MAFHGRGLTQRIVALHRRSLPPGVKLVVFVVSHILVFSVGAAWFAGYRTRAMFQDAAQDPLNRVGAAMMADVGKNATSSLDTDLSELSSTVPPPTADVIRLAVLIERGRIEEAGVACTGLAWRRCDPQTLSAMRKVLVR